MTAQGQALTAEQRTELADEQRVWRQWFSDQWWKSLKQCAVVALGFAVLAAILLPELVGWPLTLASIGVLGASIPVLALPPALSMLPAYPDEASYRAKCELKAMYQSMLAERLAAGDSGNEASPSV